MEDLTGSIDEIASLKLNFQCDLFFAFAFSFLRAHRALRGPGGRAAISAEGDPVLGSKPHGRLLCL
jgi:hypothetical protein